ncbi:MAG TPA: L-rhamnose/proton symporter RhaT [Terracidiphilus sp.]|nr:L-rhamnose/proton symporter RhaT [Terracidiphilus sp.]
MSPIASGFLLLLVAGVANANFATPMKFTRRWAWENTWLAWTIFALLVIPSITTMTTVPALGEVYRQAGWKIVIGTALFGAGWGVAQVFFGLAVDAIGVSLTFSIVMGISAAVGSLVPLMRLHSELLFTRMGGDLVGGVLIMLFGVVVCALAGKRRESAQGRNGDEGSHRYGAGLLLAVLCGMGASFVNLGLAFGGAITAAASQQGASSLNAVNAVWLPIMVAGAVPNLAYCIYLLRKNDSVSRFCMGGLSHWLLALLMAVLWFGSTILYGLSTVRLGALGTVLGWPLFMSLIVISASVVGLLTGEWKNSGRTPIALQSAGVGLLTIAVFVLTCSQQ